MLQVHKGTEWSDIDTPALLIDLDVVERVYSDEIAH